MVERLKCDDSACEHWPHPEGDLVRFEDYEALEVNALRELAAAQTAYVARGMELRDAEARLAEAEALLRWCDEHWRNHVYEGSPSVHFLSRIDAFLAADSADGCDHEWVDARNEVIASGEWCRKCNAIRAADQPTERVIK